MLPTILRLESISPRVSCLKEASSQLTSHRTSRHWRSSNLLVAERLRMRSGRKAPSRKLHQATRTPNQVASKRRRRRSPKSIPMRNSAKTLTSRGQRATIKIVFTTQWLHSHSARQCLGLALASRTHIIKTMTSLTIQYPAISSRMPRARSKPLRRRPTSIASTRTNSST